MKFIKSNKDYLISFFVPFLIYLIVFLLIKYSSGSVYATVISDLEAQYVALLAKLRDILTFNQNPFYSFSHSLGGSLFGTIVYYLISPINLIVLLFPRFNMMDASMIIIGFKIALAGLMMNIMFKRLDFKVPKELTLLLSTCYALMGYIVGYYFHLMWLDAIYLVPLVVIGIDELFKGKKSLIYLIALTLTFIFNFYIGYMVAIFSVVYFIYKFFLFNNQKKDKIKIILNYSFLSILSGVLSAFVILPMLKELSLTQKAVSNVFTIYKASWNFNISEIFSRFYIGYHDVSNLLNLESYHLYIGIFTLVLISLYFSNKTISKKEKTMSLLVIFLFFISFMLNYLSYIWHGFNIPLAFNFRFSFLFSFFLIFLAFKGLSKLKSNTKENYLISASLFIILSAVVMIFNYDTIKYYYIYISLALFVSYLGLIYLYNDKKYLYKRKLILTMILFLGLSELFFNFSNSLSTYNFTSMKEKKENTEFVLKLMSEIKQIDNSKFYRFEKNFTQTYLDPMYFGYNGLSSFVSTMKQTQLNFYKATGYSSITNSIMYKNPNFLIDSINGFKYVALRSRETSFYETISEHEYSTFDGLMYGVFKSKVSLQKNPYALGLGYEVSNNTLSFIEELKKHDTLTYFQFNNIVSSSMYGEEIEIFKTIDVNKIDNYNYEFPTNGKKYFYVYVENDITEENKAFDVIVNNEVIGTYNMREKYIMLFENNSENSIAKIELKVQGEFSFFEPIVSYFDEEKFSNFISNMKKKELNIVNIKDGYLKGRINSEKGEILYTSIPFEPGWSAKVNGEKVKIHDVFGSFIGLELEKGYNEIELKYRTPLLIESVLISFIGIVIAYLYFKKEKNIFNNLSKFILKKYEIISYLIVGFMTTLVSVFVYFIFTRFFLVNYLISESISWISAVTFAFFMNKKYVFNSKNKDILQELFSFFKYRFLSLFIDIFSMYSLVSIIKVNDLIAKVLVQILVIILNYYFSKKYVFRKKTN